MPKIDTVAFVCMVWLVAFSIGCTFVYVTSVLKKQNWLRWFKVFQYSGPEKIERQILSFDKAVLPKIATDEDGVISNVNPAAEMLFGWKENELYMKNVEILMNDKGAFQAMMKDLKGKKMATRMDFRSVNHRNTHEIEVEVTTRKEPIDGNFVYLFIFRDRTADLRKVRMLEQIIEAHKMWIDILGKGEEIGGNGSWMWDVETGMLRVTKGYKQIIGETGKQMEYEAQYLRDKVWKDDNEIVNAGLAKAHAGEQYEITYHLKRLDLDIAKIKSTAYPIMSDNGLKLLYVYGSTHLIEIIPLEEFYKRKKSWK